MEILTQNFRDMILRPYPLHQSYQHVGATINCLEQWTNLEKIDKNLGKIGKILKKFGKILEKLEKKSRENWKIKLVKGLGKASY